MGEVVGVEGLLSGVAMFCDGSEGVGIVFEEVESALGVAGNAGSKDGTRRFVSWGRRSRLMEGVGCGESIAVEAEATSSGLT